MNRLIRYAIYVLLVTLVPPLPVAVGGPSRLFSAPSGESPGEAPSYSPEPLKVQTGRAERKLLRLTVEQPGQIEGFE